jgi:hypothetical protein
MRSTCRHRRPRPTGRSSLAAAGRESGSKTTGLLLGRSASFLHVEEFISGGDEDAQAVGELAFEVGPVLRRVHEHAGTGDQQRQCRDLEGHVPLGQPIMGGLPTGSRVRSLSTFLTA